MEDYIDPNKKLDEIINKKTKDRYLRKMDDYKKSLQYLAESNIVCEPLPEKSIHKKLSLLVHQINPSNYSKKKYDYELKHTNPPHIDRKAA